MSSILVTLASIILGVAYVLVIVFTITRILLDTHATSKTLAYILVVLVLPVIGILLYFSFGVNYRHKKLSNKLNTALKKITEDYQRIVPDNTKELLKKYPALRQNHEELVHFLHTLGGEKLSINEYQLLINGEEKFPEVLRTLETARHFIHMEYYDWENDTRGNQIKDVLLNKHREGVAVRIMYDAYASRKVKSNIVKELKTAGVEIYPVIKVNLAALANRMNHRDHRKVIIVDGHTGFIGGINISDRYDNSIDTGLYWRDTHVKITGETAHNLQRHFLINWNACQPNELLISEALFPETDQKTTGADVQLSQVIAGGPVYRMSNIMLSYFKIFTSAKEKLYVTNPYFIPSESILDALKQAALSGVDVRLMMPEKSDSGVVGAASKFYYEELLQAGVRILLYKKGFVHAKTVVADGNLSVIGTANMDIRSFDLNFEIMSVTYGKQLAAQLENAFLEDQKESREVTKEEWEKESLWKKLTYAVARLVSSFL